MQIKVIRSVFYATVFADEQDAFLFFWEIAVAGLSDKVRMYRAGIIGLELPIMQNKPVNVSFVNFGCGRDQGVAGADFRGAGVDEDHPGLPLKLLYIIELAGSTAKWQKKGEQGEPAE